MYVEEIMQPVQIAWFSDGNKKLERRISLTDFRSQLAEFSIANGGHCSRSRQAGGKIIQATTYFFIVSAVLAF